MATCTDIGFVQVTLRQQQGGVTEIFVNPHWIVEIRPNPESGGADLFLESKKLPVKESVEDIWTRIQESGPLHV